MATSARRAAARKTAARAAPASSPAPQHLQDEPAADEAPPPAIDSALDAWTAGAAREQLAWQIGLCRAVLHGAKAVRQAQMEAAEHAESAQLRAADQLLSARGVSEFAEIQFDLMRANAEEAMQYWSRLGELAVRSAAEALQEGGAGWARLSSAAWDGLNQWTRWQASVPQTADLVEAEVEHVANPFAASPLAWPAQEAARQAFDLATSTWRDWWGNMGPGRLAATPEG